MPEPLTPSSDQQAQDHLQSIDSHMLAISSNIGKLVTLLKIVLALLIVQALMGLAAAGFSIVMQSRSMNNEKLNEARLEQLQAMRDQQRSSAPDHGEEHSEETDEGHGEDDSGDEDH